MKRQKEDDATAVIRKFDEAHSKYRFMELNLMQKKRRLKKQVPDIKGSLDMLQLIKARRVSLTVLIKLVSNQYNYVGCM